ncbi:MAG: hypothetical protein H7251_11080 [Acetobacteraceae bacterium]|nr:hypothetical protein [Acetobacteraceae bacterium]
MTVKAQIWILMPAAFLLLGDSSGSDFDRVVAALKAGQTAEAIGGSKQTVTLRIAAAMLIAAGARPAEGSENLASRWQSAATRADLAHGGAIAAYRNRALGPAYRTVNLPGGGRAVFEQVFLAGQRARVSVVPVSNSDFQLTINDDDKRRVCRNTQTGSNCEWVPLWTTRFSVNIANPGESSGTYYLIIQ